MNRHRVTRATIYARFYTDAADNSRTAHAVGRSVGTLMGSVIRPGFSERCVPAQRALPVLCAWGKAPD